jgi:long-chain acyl-CoA synthetase
VPIGRVAAWLARQVELALAESDLSLPQYRVLGLLDEGTSVPSSLADRLAVRRPSITAVVDGLVARGLVTRTHADDDRRRVAHVITPSGQKSLRAADVAVEARLDEIAGSLDDDDLAQQALGDLRLWGRALGAWHAKKVAP